MCVSRCLCTTLLVCVCMCLSIVTLTACLCAVWPSVHVSLSADLCMGGMEMQISGWDQSVCLSVGVWLLAPSLGSSILTPA